MAARLSPSWARRINSRSSAALRFGTNQRCTARLLGDGGPDDLGRSLARYGSKRIGPSESFPRSLLDIVLTKESPFPQERQRPVRSVSFDSAAGLSIKSGTAETYT